MTRTQPRLQLISQMAELPELRSALLSGKRIRGLKLDHPRQLALMRFSHIAAESTFPTAELHPQTAEALGCSTADYRLSSLRYDLSKLRAKGLVEKIPHSRRYRLLPNGYRICLVFPKLFEHIYAPLTAGLLRPFPQTNTFSSTVSLNWIVSTRRSPTLSTFFSMPSASKPLDYVRNENKIFVSLSISN